MWEKASQLADAYKVGRSESAAALALLNWVDPPVVAELSAIVKFFGEHVWDMERKFTL